MFLVSRPVLTTCAIANPVLLWTRGSLAMDKMQVQAAIAALYGSDAAESARANTFLMEFTEQPVRICMVGKPTVSLVSPRAFGVPHSLFFFRYIVLRILPLLLLYLSVCDTKGEGGVRCCLSVCGSLLLHSAATGQEHDAVYSLYSMSNNSRGGIESPRSNKSQVLLSITLFCSHRCFSKHRWSSGRQREREHAVRLAPLHSWLPPLLGALLG